MLSVEAPIPYLDSNILNHSTKPVWWSNTLSGNLSGGIVAAPQTASSFPILTTGGINLALGSYLIVTGFFNFTDTTVGTATILSNIAIVGASTGSYNLSYSGAGSVSLSGILTPTSAGVVSITMGASAINYLTISIEDSYLSYIILNNA